MIDSEVADDRFHLVLTLAKEVDVRDLLDELVPDVLEDLAEPPDSEDILEQGFLVRWVKELDGVVLCRLVLNVHEVSADAEDRRRFVAGLLDRLAADRERVFDCVRFFDLRIVQVNQTLANELFELEMKLREALTLLILSVGGTTVSEMLKNGTVSPKLPPGAQELRAPQAENELFYLLFSDYANVNTAKRPDLNSILAAVASHQDFNEFKQFVTRGALVADETLEDFLASVQTLMDPIEKVRNAVAHNRAVRSRHLSNYNRARDQLHERLSDVLAEFQ